MSFVGLLGPAAIRVGSVIDRIAEFASRPEPRRTQRAHNDFIDRLWAARRSVADSESGLEAAPATETNPAADSPWKLFTESKHAASEAAGVEQKVNERTDAGNAPAEAAQAGKEAAPPFKPAWTETVSSIVDEQGNYAGEVPLNASYFPTLATAQGVQQLAKQAGIDGELTTTVTQDGPTSRSAPEYNLMVEGNPYSAGLLARMMAMHPDTWQTYFAAELKYMQNAESAVNVDYIASGLQAPVSKEST